MRTGRNKVQALITGLWIGQFTTIVVVLHAIGISFYSSVKRERGLIPLYVSLFAIATIKIILYNLRDFSIFEKIIAFTVIGIVLLAAAYGLQKFIIKRDDNA